MNREEPHVSDQAGSKSQQRCEFTCPSCDSGGETGVVFYEARQVPAHSCLLMSDLQQAVQYPRGNIRLSFCQVCGFVTNQLCDPSLQAYSPLYEETQHFSNRFSTFARGLANRWIERYDIRGQTILEIGCGKGEFLELLCELGNNRGIGVDPGCIPERLSEAANSRMTFIRDYYSEKYSQLTADVICCRHTLEHILAVGPFIQMLRRTLGQRYDTLVLFELPDMTRVLRERAFWDIYYEHCSYFTAGSLARLFRRNCFDVLELERDFDDQYLLFVARPTAQPTSGCLADENDLEQTARDVAAFRQACPDSIRTWQQRLSQLAADGRTTIAWGAGSKCVSFCSTLGITDQLAYVVDINPYKQGKFLPGTGHKIVGPDFLRQQRPHVVVVMNPIYCTEIQQKLNELGVVADLMPA